MAYKAKHPYRHVFGTAARTEGQFVDIGNPMASGESNFIAANRKYLAFARITGGVSPVYILNSSNPGRMSKTKQGINIHAGKTLDIQFNPFNDNILGTCGEDATICLTNLSDEWVESGSEAITAADVSLKGHTKKISLMRFNPVADGIIASASFDKTVKIWNSDKTCEYSSLAFANTIYSVEWNYGGTQVAALSKDKKLTIWDPRGKADAQETSSFEGTKSSKVFWMDNKQKIGACGFTKTAQRELRIWDLRKLSAPLYAKNTDSATSVQMPFYDPDNGILYIYGRGADSINYYAIVNDSKLVHKIESFRFGTPVKGGAWLPKSGVNVWKCELARFYGLTSKSIIPVTFECPRKDGAERFQSDIFPDTLASVPSMNSEQFEAGEEVAPLMVSMDPANQDEAPAGAAPSSSSAAEPMASAASEDVKDEDEAPEAEAEPEAVPEADAEEEAAPAEEEAAAEEPAAEEPAGDGDADADGGAAEEEAAEEEEEAAAAEDGAEAAEDGAEE